MDKKRVVQEIVQECRRQGLRMLEQQAYVLATVQHETNRTFRPVREAYWLSEGWRQRNLRYWPFYGRGYVQITWEANYRKFSELLGVDLVRNPELSMEHENALFILVYGFKHGFFTGKKLEAYVRVGKIDFVGARRCINGRDRAKDIARLAEEWLLKLV